MNVPAIIERQLMMFTVSPLTCTAVDLSASIMELQTLQPVETQSTFLIKSAASDASVAVELMGKIYKVIGQVLSSPLFISRKDMLCLSYEIDTVLHHVSISLIISLLYNSFNTLLMLEGIFYHLKYILL